MPFRFQVWEHSTDLSLQTDTRQNFLRLIKVQLLFLSPREASLSGSLLIFCWNIQLLKSPCYHKDNSKTLLKLILRNQLALKGNRVHKGFLSVLYVIIDNCLSNIEIVQCTRHCQV